MSIFAKAAASIHTTTAQQTCRNRAERLYSVYCERRQLRALMNGTPEARADVGLTYRDLKMALGQTRYWG